MLGAATLGACGAKVSMGTGGSGSDAGGAAGAQLAGGRGGASEPTAGSAAGGQSSERGGSVSTGAAPSLGGKAGFPTGGTTSRGGSVGNGGVGGDSTPDFPGEPITTTTKLDLLLVVDNSIGMAVKQKLFREALDTTLRRLVNPPCVSASKSVDVAVGAACPAGTARASTPITDLHVGVISTSLGAHGGDTCTDPLADDRGQLIPSVRPAAELDSYQGLGFTKWDATGGGMPAGLADIDTFVQQVDATLAAVGTVGCGYEAQLESWYRFLIDPEPPLIVGRTTDQLTGVEGINGELLAQRNAFLRPDSAVAIALVTDENDCSIMDEGQGWLVGLQTNGGATFRFPRATSACATNPNDVCCRSCGSIDDPAGCVPITQDMSCRLPAYTAAEDHLNLRCFEQKRRFGVDLLYPVERYIQALTSPWVRRRDGGWAANPLFTEYEGKSRRPSLITFASILGVPWQDVATPNSLTGDGLEFLPAQELMRSGRWNVISKGPGNADPLDPFMIESAAPRSTTLANPITGDPIVGVESTDATANAINGHEQMNDGTDLQKACIFELPEPVVGCIGAGCWCTQATAANNRAMCQAPDGNTEPRTQYYEPVTPGGRQLSVLRGIGNSAVVASACPKLLAADHPDRGYLPALRALEARLADVVR
jgi:hypothetical protein